MEQSQPAGVGGAAERADRGVTRMLFDGLLLFASLAVLLGWGWQGLFKLDRGESAVILRLGAHHRTRAIEGWWAHLPPPLESHVIVDTGRLRTEAFGENPTRSTPGTPSDREEGAVANALTREAIQTADHNVVHVSYELQYTIGDAHAWAFSMADPAAVLHDAAEASLRSVIGKRDIDAVLSQDRDAIEREAEAELGRLLARYAGAVGQAPAISVERINLEKPQAPEQVREAFADVVSAGQDEKRATLTAKGDASEIMERARSEAAEIRERADAYRAAKIIEARGEAARFDALLVEYRAAPEVTRRRLYLETMESILPGLDKTIAEAGELNLWTRPPGSVATPEAGEGNGSAARRADPRPANPEPSPVRERTSSGTAGSGEEKPR